MNKETKIYNKEYAKKKILVFRRDEWKCMSGLEKHTMPLDVDHIRKRSLRGTNEMKNLITLCRGCHEIFETMSNYKKEETLYAILKRKYSYKY